MKRKVEPRWLRWSLQSLWGNEDGCGVDGAYVLLRSRRAMKSSTQHHEPMGRGKASRNPTMARAGLGLNGQSSAFVIFRDIWSASIRSGILKMAKVNYWTMQLIHDMSSEGSMPSAVHMYENDSKLLPRRSNVMIKYEQS
jgi:hypothetical protein